MTSLSISPGHRHHDAPMLPTEIWERIIDIIAADKTDLFQRWDYLSSLALVCRSWTPRARYHLLEHVRLSSSSDLNGFLLTLSKNRGSGDSVQKLSLHSPLGRQSLPTSVASGKQHRAGNPWKPLETVISRVSDWRSSNFQLWQPAPVLCRFPDVGEDLSEAYPSEWVHKAIRTLPPLLPNLRTLGLFYMPTLHPVTSILWSRFVNVEELYLGGSKDHSFSELTRIINGFPKLRTLKLTECTWSRPIRFCYRIGGPQPTNLINRGLTNAVCARDFAKWASSSQLISSLTYLEWTVMGTASEVNDVLRGCSHSLQTMFLTVEQPDETWGKWPYARVFNVYVLCLTATQNYLHSTTSFTLRNSYIAKFRLWRRISSPVYHSSMLCCLTRSSFSQYKSLTKRNSCC